MPKLALETIGTFWGFVVFICFVLVFLLTEYWTHIGIAYICVVIWMEFIRCPFTYSDQL